MQPAGHGCRAGMYREKHVGLTGDFDSDGQPEFKFSAILS